MDYQIVTLDEKCIMGLAATTSNTAPDMGKKIGSLWYRLYGENLIDTIPNKIGETIYGLYTNYENDVNGTYDAIAGCQIQKTESCRESESPFVFAAIPAGRYAKFSIIADMKGNGIRDAWKEIWATDLNRSYTVDFEEYLFVGDVEKAPVNIYISLAD